MPNVEIRKNANEPARRSRRTPGGCCRTKIFLALALALFAAQVTLLGGIARSRAEQVVDTPAEGIGRVCAEDVQLYTAGSEVVQSGTALRVFCETDPDLPAWWSPETAEVVYQAEPVKDIASPDWNLNTSLVGWDGHMMEEWEMNLFSMCFYLEFWGTSELCCQAGCDAMLNLWASGLYGKTMGESLWAVNDFGKYVYSVYPYVWTTNYDMEGLAWCREFCENRFQTGPQFDAMYFQLYGFHDPKWATPRFEVDGVYFSASRGDRNG